MYRLSFVLLFSQLGQVTADPNYQPPMKEEFVGLIRISKYELPPGILRDEYMRISIIKEGGKTPLNYDMFLVKISDPAFYLVEKFVLPLEDGEVYRCKIGVDGIVPLPGGLVFDPGPTNIKSYTIITSCESVR